MAERDLQAVLAQLKSQNVSWDAASSLLSKAKLLLLKLSALSPSSPPQPQPLLALARETYEQGALHSIRARDPEAFTRYVTQLAPFYELPAAVLAPGLAERNRVTGLYLLLLLTQGRYAEFHSELESLSTREGGGGSVDVEGDRFLGYPIRLERWLMEGSYDRVWKAMKSREVPSEEYAVFSEVSSTSPLPGSPLLYPHLLCSVDQFDVCSCPPPDTTLTKSSLLLDPHLPDPLRDRLLQRARLPQPPHLLHQVSALPRLRGRRHGVRPRPRLDPAGWYDLLPQGDRGPAGGRGGRRWRRRCQGRHEQAGHRERAGLCERAGDNCIEAGLGLDGWLGDLPVVVAYGACVLAACAPGAST